MPCLRGVFKRLCGQNMRGGGGDSALFQDMRTLLVRIRMYLRGQLIRVSFARAIVDQSKRNFRSPRTTSYDVS